MPKALIITDNTSLQLGAPRYLGAYRIADDLEKIGLHTIVIDHFFSIPDFFSLLENILDDDFILVGISSTFLSPPRPTESERTSRTLDYYRYSIVAERFDDVKNWFAQFSAVVTRRSPKAKVIVGGAKASRFLDPPLSGIPGIDVVALGAVDSALSAAAKDLIEGKELKTIRHNGREVLDTSRTYIQAGDCPKHSWRPHWHIQWGEALPIEVARGCVFNCKFCLYEKKRSDKKGVDDLRREFIDNYERYGTTFYHFVDDCFNDHREKVESVCRVIKSLPFKIEWVSYARFDVAVKFPETTKMMVESGARGLYWGVESLNHEVARRAGKGTPSEKIKEFMLNFRRDYGDECYSAGSFISGLPGETRESWLREVDWLVSNKSFHFIHVGSLLIAPYKAFLDMKEIDYADYSRNPGKYGFEKIEFNPIYWKHATMDFHEAEELTRLTVETWAAQNPLGVSQDIWQYPVWRSYGFSPEEIRGLFLNSNAAAKASAVAEISDRRIQHIQNYVADLRHAAQLSLPTQKIGFKKTN